MAEPLSNMYSKAFLQQFSEIVHTEYKQFDKQAFMNKVLHNEWDNYTLKQRIHHITCILGACLPSNYIEAITILMRIHPKCKGFAYVFLPEFVAVFGMQHWDISMDALALFTEGSTSEFAVRPFIQQDPHKMMRQLEDWATSHNHHIRRLASEGCRPKLPWAAPLRAFIDDPTPIFPILERLKNDESEYVRKSVANNINDISKNHPERIIMLAKQWYGHSTCTNWIVKHGCRTLLRQANPQILNLFSLNTNPKVMIKNMVVEQASIKIGDTLNFSFTIEPQVDEPQLLRVEYGMDFVKANQKTSRKLFKISEITLQHESKSYAKKHSFKNLTTRKHYPGVHHLAIVINGVEQLLVPFTVTND